MFIFSGGTLLLYTMEARKTGMVAEKQQKSFPYKTSQSMGSVAI